MMQNGTKYADGDERELNLESVAYELKNLVDARIEIDREGGFVAVKNPTENELSDLSDYVDSSDSVRGYPIREEDKLIVEPCSGVMSMSCDAEFTRRYELIQSGLAVVSELEERTETEGSPRLDQTRSCLVRAGKEIGTPEFDRRLSKAMGLASSIAVSHEYDSLAEDALKLGSDGSWIECSTVEKQEENIYRACELVVDEPFGNASSPDELVQRTESVLDELNCEVRTDFDEMSQLFFIDIADPDCAGVVEIVLDELEWYTSFWYREYEESYVGEFIRNVAPTTEGQNV